MADFCDGNDRHPRTRSASSSSSSRRSRSLRSRVRRLFTRKDAGGIGGYRSAGGCKPRSMSAAAPDHGAFAPRSPTELRSRGGAGSAHSLSSISRSSRSTASRSRSSRPGAMSHHRDTTQMSVSDLHSMQCFDSTITTTPSVSHRTDYPVSYSATTSPNNTNTSVSYVDPLVIQAESPFGGSATCPCPYASSTASSSPMASSRPSEQISYGLACSEVPPRSPPVAPRVSRASTSSTVKFTENESYHWLANVVSADIEYSVNETTEVFDDDEDAAGGAGLASIAMAEDATVLAERALHDRSQLQLFLPNMKESSRGVFLNM